MAENSDDAGTSLDEILSDLLTIQSKLDKLGFSMASIHMNGAIEELRTQKIAQRGYQKD